MIQFSFDSPPYPIYPYLSYSYTDFAGLRVKEIKNRDSNLIFSVTMYKYESPYLFLMINY